jgi:hypothetical protein
MLKDRQPFPERIGRQKKASVFDLKQRYTFSPMRGSSKNGV